MAGKDEHTDIINAVDTLYMYGKKNFNSFNPVSELITPEWHYSASVQILDNIQINWEKFSSASCQLCPNLSLNWKDGMPNSTGKMAVLNNMVGITQSEIHDGAKFSTMVWRWK